MSKFGIYLFYYISKVISLIKRKNLISTHLSITSNHERYQKWRAKGKLIELKNFSEFNLNETLTNKKIVDFGCGTGELTKILTKFNPEKIIGIDISEEDLNIARKKYSGSLIEFRKGSEMIIPFNSNLIDVIFCLDVLEHISNVVVIFDEFVRILKPGGKIYIAWQSWFSPFASHLDTYTLIPWIQIIFSEKTIFKACAKIYDSNWFITRFWDKDTKTIKKTKYLE